MDLLESYKNSDVRIVFTLSATDGLSGTKVVQQVAYSFQDIKYGKFEIGFIIEEVAQSDSEIKQGDDHDTDD